MSNSSSAFRARSIRFGALAALALVAGCGKKDDAAATAAAPDAPTVLRLNAQDVAKVIESSVAGGVQISGPLEPATTVVLKAQIDGTVHGFTVDRGSNVTKGQTLVMIEGPGLEEQRLASRAAVASAEADLAVAKQNLAASQKLAAAGALSQLDLKTAAAQQQGADARLASARAQERMAEQRLKYGTVTAPIAGAVSERVAEDGQAIRIGDPILTLVDPRTLELKGQIGVDEAGTVRVGQKVSFTLDASPDKSWAGIVARIDPSANPATRQVGVYARLANGDRHIVAGQFAHGRIETGAAKGKSLMVPTNAVRSDTDGSHFVFVLTGGKATKRVVTIGFRDDATGLTVVSTGVTAGEVVIATTAPITEGAQIQVPAADSGKGT